MLSRHRTRDVHRGTQRTRDVHRGTQRTRDVHKGTQRTRDVHRGTQLTWNGVKHTTFDKMLSSERNSSGENGIMLPRRGASRQWMQCAADTLASHSHTPSACTSAGITPPSNVAARASIDARAAGRSLERMGCSANGRHNAPSD